MPTSPRRRVTGDAAIEPYTSLTTRAGAQGWRVRLGIAHLQPVRAPGGPAHERVGLTFRATLLRDGRPVAESRGRHLTIDALPSMAWRDAGACAAFVAAAREWWRDEAEPDAAVAAHVIRELVWERALEIGQVNHALS